MSDFVFEERFLKARIWLREAIGLEPDETRSPRREEFASHRSFPSCSYESLHLKCIKVLTSTCACQSWKSNRSISFWETQSCPIETVSVASARRLPSTTKGSLDSKMYRVSLPDVDRKRNRAIFNDSSTPTRYSILTMLPLHHLKARREIPILGIPVDSMRPRSNERGLIESTGIRAI